MKTADFVDDGDIEIENVTREANGRGAADSTTARSQSSSPQIKLIPFDEITLGTQRRDLVKGLIPRVGLTVAWGPPKCGKSFWTFDLALHVALGWEYRGRRVHQGSVVYCAFEGQTGIEARVAAFRKRSLAGHVDKVPLFLEPITLDLVRDHRALIAAIKRQLGEEKPVAVALDTLNRSIRGSESSDEDMTAYVNAADAIRAAFDCAVIIIHHCGIDGTRPRGHTSLTGAADAQLASSGTTMSQQSSLTQSAHSVRQVLTAYMKWLIHLLRFPALKFETARWAQVPGGKHGTGTR